MADWQIKAAGPGASDFELIGETGRLSLRSALPGDFNRVNTAVAALILLAAGYPGSAIEKALAADPHVPGRMERVFFADDNPVPEETDQGRMPLAFVDFAHTPDAVAAALKALRHNTSGSLIVVLGAGGDRDAGKRAAMGAAAAAHADLVVVTDDNPRSEDPATIRAALIRGALAQDQSAARPSPGRIAEIGDRAAAIRAAVARAGFGDTVAVLGKGHESGQEIAGVVHPFDDRAELRAALIERTASSERTAPGSAPPATVGPRTHRSDSRRGQVIPLGSQRSPESPAAGSTRSPAWGLRIHWWTDRWSPTHGKPPRAASTSHGSARPWTAISSSRRPVPEAPSPRSPRGRSLTCRASWSRTCRRPSSPWPTPWSNAAPAPS